MLACQLVSPNLLYIRGLKLNFAQETEYTVVSETEYSAWVNAEYFARKIKCSGKLGKPEYIAWKPEYIAWKSEYIAWKRRVLWANW